MRFAEGDPLALLAEFFEPEPAAQWLSLAEGERIITGH